MNKARDLISSFPLVITGFNNWIGYFKYFLLLCFIISCSSFGIRQDTEKVKAQNKFRYVNLNIIFDYLSSNDYDGKSIKKRREDILQKINILTEQLSNLKDEKNKNDLLEKQNQYKAELAKLKSDEDHYKNTILNRIDRALDNIAKRSDIDFVFNIGEGAVYAKKEYDITEEVLREVLKLKERSSPISR